MKNLVSGVVIALLVAGLLAAASAPTQSKSIIMLGSGGPVPLCAPGDCSCDPGPGLPPVCPNQLTNADRAQQALDRVNDPKLQFMSSGGPVPLCAPGDCKCNPGPGLPPVCPTR